MKLKESRLTKPVVSFLKQLGCEPPRTELPFVDRGIDIFALKSLPTVRSYAVELKIDDWQKALRQAAIYQLCADYCYVAMPKEKVHKLQLEGFREAGVGVLCVDLESMGVEVLSDARKSPVKRASYSSYIESAARR